MSQPCLGPLTGLKDPPARGPALPMQDTIVHCSPPGRPDCFCLHTWREGRGYKLGPYTTNVEARAALGVLRTKARQVDGAPQWDSRLGDINATWQDYVAATPWCRQLEDLGGAAVGEEEGARGPALGGMHCDIGAF